MNPHLQSIYDKGGKNIQWGKDILFNQWCWENWTTTCKRIKLDYFFTPCTKIKSQWSQRINLMFSTVKFLEENKGSTLFDIGLSNIFWMSSQARKMKAKINQWDYIKLKSFCMMKETIHKV